MSSLSQIRISFSIISDLVRCYSSAQAVCDVGERTSLARSVRICFHILCSLLLNLRESRTECKRTQFNPGDLQAEPPDNPLSMKRQKSKSVSTQQFLSFKCDHCKSEFEASAAYRTHRTHYAAQRTPCSLEENRIELIYTERHDHATGRLREVRSSKLGVQFIY